MIGIMEVPIAKWNNLGKMCPKCTHSVFLKDFIYFWLCWIFPVAWAFSGCGEWGLLPSCSAQASLLVASPVAEHRLQSTWAGQLQQGFSFSPTCGIFPDQGSNSCLLHWQADSLPLSLQGNLTFGLMTAIPQPDLLPCLRILLFHVAPKYTLQTNTRNLLIPKCC